MRIVRIAKLGRYLPALMSLKRVFKRRKEELILSLSVLFLLLVMAASLMYYAEREAQPEVFSSIPATMWWAVATLTTVGCGDIYPITTLGRILASAVAILGIGLVALPAGILAFGLQEEMQRMKTLQKDVPFLPDDASPDEDGQEARRPRAMKYCPRCGKPLCGDVDGVDGRVAARAA